MIEKQAFYRGAAIFELLHDDRTEIVRPVRPGFVINDEVFALIKYTAKVATPWHFTFSSAEREAIEKHQENHVIVLALVCGDDGVCAVRWEDLDEILDDPPTWISASRKVNKRYKVTGNHGEMIGRVPRNRWPGALFDERTD